MRGFLYIPLMNYLYDPSHLHSRLSAVVDKDGLADQNQNSLLKHQIDNTTLGSRDICTAIKSIVLLCQGVNPLAQWLESLISVQEILGSKPKTHRIFHIHKIIQ